MIGDDIFNIPVFTESGEANPALIERIREDIGTNEENRYEGIFEFHGNEPLTEADKRLMKMASEQNNHKKEDHERR